jgi:hypothetical protein
MTWHNRADAAKVIFVARAPKLVPPWKPRTSGSTPTACPWKSPAGRLRQPSQAGKILKIHQELPGRIHIVLIRQQVGY